MEKMIKRIVCLLLAGCMVFSLTACGKEKEPEEESIPASTENQTSESETSAEPEAVEPEAAEPEVIEPEEVEPESDFVEPSLDMDNLVEPGDLTWGYQYNDGMDAQYWYPNGDRSSLDYLIIDGVWLYMVTDGEKDENFIGLDNVDKHLVTHDSEAPYFDLVFADEMSCYDLAGEQWYLRCDKATALESLTAERFYAEDKEDTYLEFHKDGTHTFVWDGEVKRENELWWFKDARHVECDNPAYETTATYDIHYAEDSWEIVGVEDAWAYAPK